MEPELNITHVRWERGFKEGPKRVILIEIANYQL